MKPSPPPSAPAPSAARQPPESSKTAPYAPAIATVSAPPSKYRPVRRPPLAPDTPAPQAGSTFRFFFLSIEIHACSCSLHSTSQTAAPPTSLGLTQPSVL